MEDSLSRRQIVRQFIVGSVASWVGGAWISQRVVAVQSPIGGSVATVRVRPSLFPVLFAVGGSVRLNVGLDYPVAINRGPGNAFYAVNTRCAHQGCTVNAFDSGPNVMRCGCHGSTYTIDGSLAGGPATRGLDRYEAVFDGNDTVTVRVPGVTFAAQAIEVQSTAAPTQRIKLTFTPSIFSRYEVHYTQTLAGTPQVASFSRTPTGAATETVYQNTVFDPENPLPTVTLYVDAVGTRGFFSIALLLSEY
jgi:Rieske Fe-S protein